MATISEALAVAVQYHQSGNLQQAEAIYRQILQVDPSNADALHLLGVIADQVGSMTWRPVHQPGDPDTAVRSGSSQRTWAMPSRIRVSWRKRRRSIKRPSASNPTTPERTTTWAMHSGSKASWRKPWRSFKRPSASNPTTPELTTTWALPFREQGSVGGSGGAVSRGPAPQTRLRRCAQQPGHCPQGARPVGGSRGAVSRGPPP